MVHAMNRMTSRRGSWLTGCLIALGAVVLLVVAAGIYVAFTWKGWVAEGLKSAATQVAAKAELTPEQKTRLTERVDRLAEDFKGGKVSMQQMALIMKEIGEGPIPALGMMAGFEKGYVEKSTLPDEEKAAARQTFQRFARGVADKLIPIQAIEDALTPISESSTNISVGPSGATSVNRKVKSKVTDDELRAFIAKVKEKADRVQVPDEPWTIDPVAVMEQAIDKVLGAAGTVPGGKS